MRNMPASESTVYVSSDGCLLDAIDSSRAYGLLTVDLVATIIPQKPVLAPRPRPIFTPRSTATRSSIPYPSHTLPEIKHKVCTGQADSST